MTSPSEQQAVERMRLMLLHELRAIDPERWLAVTALVVADLSRQIVLLEERDAELFGSVHDTERPSL